MRTTRSVGEVVVMAMPEAPDDADHPMPPWGETITPLTEVCGGRYVLVHELAWGDLSIVYRAKRQGASETIAFKLLQPRYVGDEARVRRFRREAELLRRIEHPNVVRLVDHGTIEDGRDFIALEYLAGRTLRDTLERETRMAPERVGRIARQIARALRAMHQVGVIHRDLQPANVVLIGPPSAERVKLVDFGTAGDVGAPARRVRVDPAPRRSTGAADGRSYRPPEQVQRRPPHPTMDVYALGVMMYEMLAGEHPYLEVVGDGEAEAESDTAKRLGPHTIRTKAFDAPEELLGLVGDCIDREVEPRPPTMDAVIERLDKALLWMGVVPHELDGADEDAPTQLWEAADPSRVESPPKAARKARPSPSPSARREPSPPRTRDSDDDAPAPRRRFKPGDRRPKPDAGSPPAAAPEPSADARGRAEDGRPPPEAAPRPSAGRGPRPEPAAPEPSDEAPADTGPETADERPEDTTYDGPSTGSAPRIDLEELRIVDTVAWTKPEPSADGDKVPPRSRADRTQRTAPQRPTRRRRTAPKPPPWVLPIAIAALVLLAYAAWWVWTQ